MKQISSTDQPVLTFKGNGSQRFTMSQNKVGWLHTLASKPGAKFDIAIKDMRGSLRFERKGFGNETDRAGELVNAPFKVGEEVEVIISNFQGADSLSVLLN